MPFAPSSTAATCAAVVRNEPTTAARPQPREVRRAWAGTTHEQAPPCAPLAHRSAPPRCSAKNAPRAQRDRRRPSPAAEAEQVGAGRDVDARRPRRRPARASSCPASHERRRDGVGEGLRKTVNGDRASVLPHHEAAVDAEVLTRHVVAVRRAEVHDGPSELARIGRPPGRDQLQRRAHLLVGLQRRRGSR